MASRISNQQMNRRENLEMAAKCFFLSGNIFHRLAQEESTTTTTATDARPPPTRTVSAPAAVQTSTQTSPPPTIPIRRPIQLFPQEPVAVLAAEDGRKKIKLFLRDPVLFPEPLIEADDLPNEYRLYLPIVDVSDIKMKLERLPSTSTVPYVERGPAQNEYILYI